MLIRIATLMQALAWACVGFTLYAAWATGLVG